MSATDGIKERIRARLLELGCLPNGMIFPIVDALIDELGVDPGNLVSADADNRLRMGTDGKFFVN